MIPETSRATRTLPGWVVVLGPLLLLAALVALIVVVRRWIGGVQQDVQ